MSLTLLQVRSLHELPRMVVIKIERIIISCSENTTDYVGVSNFSEVFYGYSTLVTEWQILGQAGRENDFRWSVVPLGKWKL